RLLRALRRQDRGTTVALGAHLLLHRVLNRQGRVDRLELDTIDSNAPLARGLIEHHAKLTVDVVAARERLFEVETTDNVSQSRRRQLLYRPKIVGDLVRRSASIRHLKIDDSVD